MFDNTIDITEKRNRRRQYDHIVRTVENKINADNDADDNADNDADDGADDGADDRADNSADDGT